MDKSKVFIGYNQELKRCLLYKKSNNTYLDFEIGKKYKNFEILENTLISYNDLIKLKGYTPKTKVKKEYQKEKERKIPISHIFIGNIYQITEIGSKTYTYLSDEINYNFKANPIFLNRLLEKVGYDQYKDLFTEEKFRNGYKFERGDFFIPNSKESLRLFTEEFPINNVELEKSKILEKYQDKYDIRSVYGNN